MEFWEATFRSEFKEAYTEVSAIHRNVNFVMWYVWNRQILKFNPHDREEEIEIAAFLEGKGLIIEKTMTFHSGSIYMIRDEEKREMDVWDSADRNGCFELPPATFLNGTAEYRFAGFEEEDILNLVSDLRSAGDFQLKSKRKLPVNVLRSSLWMSSMFSSLTEKQSRCLIEAQLDGYYRIPRKTSTGGVAKKMGLSRSTFEAHLRKAENTIVNSLVPYLQLFTSTEDDDGFHHQTIDLPTAELFDD